MTRSSQPHATFTTYKGLYNSGNLVITIQSTASKNENKHFFLCALFLAKLRRL